MKNIMKNGFGLIILITLFTSCQKEPTAEFSVSKSTPAVGENVLFTNSTADGVDFLWDFGDGETSTSENPSHFYNNIGTYKVVLEAYSKNGKKSNEYTQTITVQKLKNGVLMNNNFNALSKAFFVNYGYGNIDFIAASSGISYDENIEDLVGNGDALYIECYTNSALELKEGTYIYDLSNSEFTFDDAYFIKEYNSVYVTGYINMFMDGQFDFSKNATEYELDGEFEGYFVTGVKANYTGPVTLIDMSNKKAKGEKLHKNIMAKIQKINNKN